MNNGFEKNLKAHNLYTNTPLLKAILIVITPTLLMTLMTGIYIFVSQVMITRLLPISHGVDEESNFNYWFNGIATYDYVKAFCNDPTNGMHMYTIGDIVKGSMSISAPIATITGSSPFFLAAGASVLYGQALGRQSRIKADQVFKTSFWMVIIFGLLETIVLVSINEPLLNALSSPPGTSEDPIINNYLLRAHELQIKFARQYTMIYSGGIILPLLIFYLASLIRTEGRFWVVTIANICGVVLNIGCIALFILVAKIDAYGGAIGSTISYVLMLITILTYLGMLNKKNKTWLMYRILFIKGISKFRINLVSPTILVGASAFLIDLSYAIANMVFVPTLANTAANEHIFPTANGNGMYFQTIEGAIMPILNLVFVTIYGIIEGERLIIAYNYAQGNWKRIKKTYRYTMAITFIYSSLMITIIAAALGKPILQLFDINSEMMSNAYDVLLIQMFMIPIFSFQVSAMSIYMSIGDIAKSNISSIFQDSITFFPVLGITYGICLATQNIWVLVATYVINAVVATLLIVIYTEWFLKKRFGKVKIKLKMDGRKKTLWVPVSTPPSSYVQNVLN